MFLYLIFKSRLGQRFEILLEFDQFYFEVLKYDHRSWKDVETWLLSVKEQQKIQEKVAIKK